MEFRSYINYLVSHSHNTRCQFKQFVFRQKFILIYTNWPGMMQVNIVAEILHKAQYGATHSYHHFGLLPYHIEVYINIQTIWDNDISHFYNFALQFCTNPERKDPRIEVDKISTQHFRVVSIYLIDIGPSFCCYMGTRYGTVTFVWQYVVVMGLHIGVAEVPHPNATKSVCPGLLKLLHPGVRWIVHAI